MKVGFIGLGIMGLNMGKNLMKAGHELVVYNRTKEKADELIKAGAEWADSPRQVAEKVKVLITMLSTPEVVEDVALREDGFLNGMAVGSLWADMSTVNPSFSQRMAAAAAERKLRFLDAPVAGSRGPAEEGKLLILVGGESADLEECQPLFDVMGRKTVHMGTHGMGTSMKMVINLMLGGAMQLFAEGFQMGLVQGISKEQLFDVLVGGAVTAPFVKSKVEKFESGNYSADFPLKHLQKDLHLAAETAYENGAAMPMVNAAKETYRLAMQAGLAEEDFSAIFKFLGKK